jgi:hypothetical protein
MEDRGSDLYHVPNNQAPFIEGVWSEEKIDPDSLTAPASN